MPNYTLIDSDTQKPVLGLTLRTLYAIGNGGSSYLFAYYRQHKRFYTTEKWSEARLFDDLDSVFEYVRSLGGLKPETWDRLHLVTIVTFVTDCVDAQQALKDFDAATTSQKPIEG